MTDKKIPFVGLHAHSVAGSTFDALGFPDEHMNFCHSNGGSALAITDHGNLNALPHVVLHSKKMKEQGKDFKPIFGVEAYFVPSISEWKKEYDKAKADAKMSKSLAKQSDSSGATVEDEASKKEMKSIINRRRHLILLAQNQKGLNNIFKLISESYEEQNYYRYPRMDYEMLARHSEGVIATNACLGGTASAAFWENSDYDEDGKWLRSRPEDVLTDLRKSNKRFKQIFGDRWYGEIQWNNVPQQHELNQYIIQVCEELEIEVISTADSHYPNPDAWKDRELYKRLGRLGKSSPSWLSAELPEGVEEIGYELYPKNGNQMWESYKKYTTDAGVEYDDDYVMDTITRTHDIAFERIEAFMPDATVRLPKFVIPAGETASGALNEFAFDGLRSKGMQAQSLYTDRLEHELKIISDRGFSEYFLTMKAIVDEAAPKMLIGPGRGSAVGSLVAYVLNITQVDPIKYHLPFERFLRADATDYPDIDVDYSRNMELKEHLIEKWGDNRVAPISNWNTLQLKSLIKDISKFYGIEFYEVNKVTAAMMAEATPAAKQRHGIKAGVYVPTWEEVMELSPSLRGFLVKHPDVKTHVEALIGQVKSCFTDMVGILTDSGVKTIKEIEVGDLVAYYGHDGETHYNDKYEIYFQGVKEIFEIELEDGSCIELTSDHEVLTQDGYKQVSDLCEEDFLFDVE